MACWNVRLVFRYVAFYYGIYSKVLIIKRVLIIIDYYGMMTEWICLEEFGLNFLVLIEITLRVGSLRSPNFLSFIKHLPIRSLLWLFIIGRGRHWCDTKMPWFKTILWLLLLKPYKFDLGHQSMMTQWRLWQDLNKSHMWLCIRHNLKSGRIG